MNRLPAVWIAALFFALGLALLARAGAAATPEAAGDGTREAALPRGVTVRKDIHYAEAKRAKGAGAPEQLAFKLDLYLPATPAAKRQAGAAAAIPVLVRLAPYRETPSRPANELLAKGYALIYAAYLPGDPPASGDTDPVVFHVFPTDLFAAKAAIRWVRGNAARYHFDARRIGVWGADHGATLAALLAVTADQKDLNGSLGDFPQLSPAVRCVCLFGGTTDWRHAELYGDETVNFREIHTRDVNQEGAPAYQLFGGNVKEHPDAARRASAVTYIRPNSPPLLMVTLASDSNRAMHLIFAETLRRAGVPSALYEEPVGAGAGLGGRAVDEGRLDRTILEFFGDTLAGNTQPASLTLDQEIDQLAGAGLYQQAQRMLEEQVAAAPPKARAPWLKKVRAITERQEAPAREKLIAAIKAYKAQHPATGEAPQFLPTWTGREILTDPEHIGEFQIVATPTALEYDARARALREAENLNRLVVQKDFAAADGQVEKMRALAGDGKADAALTDEYLARYGELRAHPDQAWPAGIKPVVFATASGRDLYGFWFAMRAGGIMQRFRYIPPGKFAMGSATTEWGRLPDEPILAPTEIKQGFWLADTPVTQDTWEGVMGAGANGSPFRAAKLPATNLSYAHAVNFLAQLGVGARLPTSAEWEYACRAGSRAMYPVTGRLSDSSWYWEEAPLPAAGGTGAQEAGGEKSAEYSIFTEFNTDSHGIGRSTHPVGEKLPNAWGLYDMQGNVWQWCSGTSALEPRDYHPARGGSWISIPQSCRAARTVWFPIEQQSWNLGMRIAIPAEQDR